MSHVPEETDAPLSPLETELLEGLASFCEVIASGTPIDRRYPVRAVSLDLTPMDYDAQSVKDFRERLGVSRSILARFLGVNVKAVRSWEQGTRQVPSIPRRFLDEIVDDPELFRRRMRAKTA